MGLLRARNVLETANTNRDGSGTLIYVGEVAGSEPYIDRVIYQSLGDNAVGVGRLYVKADSANQDVDAEIDYHLLCETTLPVKTGTGQTAAIDADTTSLNLELPPGSRLYASVSVDLTSSAGYLVSVATGPERQRFEAL